MSKTNDNTMKRQVLVTGGAGYIGSHTCLELIEAGFQPIVVDNFSNSCAESIRRVEKLTQAKVPVYQVDIRDASALADVLSRHRVEACIHFAGLKAVGESVAKPLSYYDNNVGGSITLLKALDNAGCKTLVFSSSATVYGDPEILPIPEDAPAGRVTNPYGRTKWMIEEILRDLYASDPQWKLGILRYFNPVGAHPSGLIGEDPNGIPNNLMPYIAQTAIGRREKLHVFGGDYPTRDGTGERDFIHVVDLAKGHIRTLEYLFERDDGDLVTLNLGTGRGTTVLELVHAFEKASGRTVPYEIVARRPGDVAVCYADPSRAEQVLGWRSELDIDDMCRDTWRWQSQNPEGYPDHK